MVSWNPGQRKTQEQKPPKRDEIQQDRWCQESTEEFQLIITGSFYKTPNGLFSPSKGCASPGEHSSPGLSTVTVSSSMSLSCESEVLV